MTGKGHKKAGPSPRCPAVLVWFGDRHCCNTALYEAKKLVYGSLESVNLAVPRENIHTCLDALLPPFPHGQPDSASDKSINISLHVRHSPALLAPIIPLAQIPKSKHKRGNYGHVTICIRSGWAGCASPSKLTCCNPRGNR